jgi:glycosyltransferase involved in cell wall biosynthesis
MSESAAGHSSFRDVAGGDSSGECLRVLHVISSMASEAGGPPVVCAGLAETLATRGHTVTIATVEKAGQHPILLKPCVTLKQFPPSREGRYLHSQALGAWVDAHIHDFDIVHLHSLWQFPTFAAARACWRAGKPYVVLLNGMLDQYVVNKRSRLLKRAYWLWREGKVEGRSKGIQFLNEAEIRRAVPWVKNMPKFILGNGIHEAESAALPMRGKFRARFPAIGNRPMALFLSRLHPKKGLDRLIPAWKALAVSQPEARLVIAGTGDATYTAELDQLITQHGLAEQIVRVGQLVGEAKWEALVDAGVFVLPSHQEGFSMAVTEALGAGCPAVVTEECNFDELETHGCGIIIRDADMSAFVQAVEALLNDPARRKTLGAAGAALVRSRYTWGKIVGDLERIYRWILAGRVLPADAAAVWRDQ